MTRRWQLSDFVAIAGGVVAGNGIVRFFTDPWQHAAAVLLGGALLMGAAFLLAYREAKP